MGTKVNGWALCRESWGRYRSTRHGTAVPVEAEPNWTLDRRAAQPEPPGPGLTLPQAQHKIILSIIIWLPRLPVQCPTNLKDGIPAACEWLVLPAINRLPIRGASGSPALHSTLLHDARHCLSHVHDIRAHAYQVKYAQHRPR